MPGPYLITDRILDVMNDSGPEQRSKEWFAMRGNRVTGSIVDPIINGRSAYTTRDRLVLEKSGMEVEFKGNVATRHGTKYEDAAIKLFEQRTGFRVIELGLVQHHKHQLLAHSPDGIVLRPNQPPALLEVKTPFRRDFENDTHIHDTYVHQVLMGCSTFECDYWYFIQYRPEGDRSQKARCFVARATPRAHTALRAHPRARRAHGQERAPPRARRACRSALAREAHAGARKFLARG